MADEIRITVLVDNYIDIFLSSTAVARYPTPGKESRLWGEQGLSLWIEVWKGSKSLRLLYDFGRGDKVLFHNAPILNIDLRSAQCLVLSHAHGDHYGGLSRALRSTPESCKLVVHPRACGIRRFVKHDDSVVGPWGLTGRLLRAFQKRVIMSGSTTALGLDTYASGGIERRTSFEKGMPNAYLEEAGVLVPDPIADDQALFIELGGQRLVVVTGCAHAGIVNTLTHAEQVFPGRTIHAVIGGFHLNNAGEAQMRETIDCFRRLNVQYIAALHCTGYHAQKALMDVFRERWIPGTVGMRITLR
jgi:7,8-dihydropterin-6-yl-methyl-4-(beta-D-ribofuranosyl)aminobenzene 5'-phosphate synthase